VVPTKIGLLLAALLVGAVVSGCDKADTGDKGYIDGTGIITRLAVDKRKKPGEVSGETLSGKKLETPVKRILQGAPVDSVVSRDSLVDPDALDAIACWRTLEGEDA